MIFATNKYKFNKYCELYSEFFNDEKPIFIKINYDKLIIKIVEQFTNMKINQRLNKEIILKDKLDEYKDMNELNMNPFITMILSLLTSLIITTFTKSIFILVEFFLILLAVMSEYFLIIEVRSYIRKVSNRGFYLLCINILEKVNSGMYKINK